MSSVMKKKAGRPKKVAVEQLEAEIPQVQPTICLSTVPSFEENIQSLEHEFAATMENLRASLNDLKNRIG